METTGDMLHEIRTDEFAPPLFSPHSRTTIKDRGKGEASPSRRKIDEKAQTNPQDMRNLSNIGYEALQISSINATMRGKL